MSVVIDAADHGVVGDGVADDTASLQSALDAAAGHALFIPAGRYLLATGSPQVRSSTVVYGEGIGRTILVQPNVHTYDRPAEPRPRTPGAGRTRGRASRP